MLVDFNQTVPPPVHVYDALMRCFSDLNFLTVGNGATPMLIDRAVASPGIQLSNWRGLPVLSDHVGWEAHFHVA